MKLFISAAAALGFCLSIGVADEVKGKIVKISDDSVSVQSFNKDTKKFEPAKDFTLSKNTKFVQLAGKEKKPLEGGAKSPVFAKLKPKKGVQATLVIDANNNVTEVVLAAPKNQVKGSLIKVADSSVTIRVKNKKDKKEEDKTFTLTKEVKVLESEKKKKSTPVADGLKAAVFKDISAEKGVQATLQLNSENQVTAILLPKKGS